MLRAIFVYSIILVGVWQSTRGAFPALLFYLWLAYFRPEQWLWDVSLFRSLNLSLIVGVYLLARYPFSEGRLRIDYRSILLVAFLFVTFASLVQMGYLGLQWVKWTDFAKSIVITLMIPSLALDLPRFRKVVLAIAFSLGFEAAKQGWVGLILHPGGRNENPFPLLGDNNGVAVGMLMLTTLFIALSRSSSKKIERPIHWFFIVGTAYRAIATYSRGAFLAAGGLIVVYVLRSDKKLRSAIATALVAGAIVTVLPPAFWDRMSTIKTTEEDLESSARSRPHFWRVAVSMANSHPLLGIGYNSYNREYNAYDFSKGAFGPGRSVHSMWFGALAETGYIGFTLFVIILMSSFMSAGMVARQARLGRIPKEFFYYAVALQTGFVACMIGGSFVPWQYTEMLWHFVGLSMALSYCAREAIAMPAPVPVPVAAPAPHRVHTRFKPAAARAG